MKERTLFLIKKLEAALNGTRHPLYNRSSMMQKEYTMWLTGEGLNEKVRRLRRREADEDYKERKEVTVQLLPRVMANARDSFGEAFRNNNIKISIDSIDNEALAGLKAQLATFNVYDSLEEFWQNKFLNLSFTDPNAWIVTKIYAGKTAPIIVSSQQMLMYEYNNHKLDYVCFVKDGTHYLWSHDIVLTCKPKELGKWEEERTDDYGNAVIGSVYITDKLGREYIVDYSEVYNYTDTFAIQVGYIPHYTVEGLYVSPAEKSRPDITRLINLCSEYDINILFHVFLQKFEYAQPCTERSCSGGINQVDGSTCSHCKGTGFEPSHGSSMDTVKLPLPFNGSANEMIDLSKLSHYAKLPIEVLNHQREELLQCIKSIEVAIAGSDIFSRKELAEAATATEINSNVQKQNNTLYPFAIKYCQTYQFFVEKVADLLLLSEHIIVSYWIDKTMLRESLAALIEQAARAQSSGVPEGLVADMFDEIAYVMYLNRPKHQMKHALRKRLNYYYSTPTQMKAAAMALLPIDNEIRVKSTFCEYILNECERREAQFYEMDLEEQDRIISNVVSEIQALLAPAIVRFDELPD